MVSRRQFLHGSALSAAAIPGVPLIAIDDPKETTCKPLPTSITALASWKDKARPITSDERRVRLDKARRLMVENKLDAIMLTAGTSLNYFTGIKWWGSERLFATLIPAKGEPFFVCPAFEQDRAQEQISNGPLPKAEILLWPEDESPYQRIAQGLRDRGIVTGTLGVEETTPFVFSQGVSFTAPQLKLASATPVTAGCRMIKDTHEVELMRLAAKVTLAAYEATYRALREGMSQNDVADLVAAAHRQLGFEGEADVQVGQYSALPHGSRTPQIIRNGTILLMDGGCKVEGYTSDITRTYVLGKATDKMKRVFDVVHRAQSAALATARPGTSCEVVDAVARNVISDAGFRPVYKYFTHRVGHGMGMDGHEWPYLVHGNTLPLVSNMVFSDEPGIYIRGEFGVRLEDDMHITENGAELFTAQSPSVEQPF